MPSTANQQPAPGQEVSLSVDRQASTIPKGGTDSTWVYPSPQMVSGCISIN
jgi:cytochrome c heme-lyase